MKKIKLGRKEYFIIERDELFKKLVVPMSKAEMIKGVLTCDAKYLKANMLGANKTEVWLLQRELESLANSAGEIKDELFKFTQGP